MIKDRITFEERKEDVMRKCGEPMTTLIFLCWDKGDENSPSIEDLECTLRAYERICPGYIDDVIRRRNGDDIDVNEPSRLGLSRKDEIKIQEETSRREEQKV